ncbi:MAG: GGDEF domain-containing protein [Catonella sp.]|uniref:GGDEF domain-containing protein n=1 Tax=Catonella sp. TaxID=2382125 RepID=UPI003FA13589
MIKTREKIRNRVQNVLLCLLLLIVLIMLYEVEKFSKAGRLISYTGFARGGVQRYVKLELYGIHDQELVDMQNKILDGLWNGSEELNLPKITDKSYRKKLKKQIEYWDKLYETVETMEHSEGKEKEKLRVIALAKSEYYFKIASNTINAAEKYAESLADYMSIFEMVLGAIVICIIALMVTEYADKKILVEQNVKLGKKAYIDAHTGLPNKSRCEEVFNNKIVTEELCSVMFDLNGLKATNDRLGHIAGDEIIKGFADILKNSMREHDFVGRYGGDEFVGVIYNPGSDGLKMIFERIEENVKIFNEEHPNLTLSYAYGYSCSKGRTDCTMKMLLSEADENMYKNKADMKKNKGDYDIMI